MDIRQITPAPPAYQGPAVGLQGEAPATPAASQTVVSDMSEEHALAENEVQQMIEEGQAQMQEAFVINRSSFALFRLPDGKMYSRVRNLDTGETQYFPTLDAFSYNEALRATTGVMLEKKV